MTEPLKLEFVEYSTLKYDNSLAVAETLAPLELMLETRGVDTVGGVASLSVVKLTAPETLRFPNASLAETRT